MNAVGYRHTLLSRTGSYWGEHIHPESASLLRSMVRLRNHSDVLSSLDRTVQSLHGEGYRTHWIHRWGSRDVAVLGPDLQQRILSRIQQSDGLVLTVLRRPDRYDIYGEHVLMQDEQNEGFFGTESCQYLLWPIPGAASIVTDPNHLQNLFILPWDFDSTPYGLVCPDGRVLTLGIDYHRGYGALVFREHPNDLWPEFKLEVLSSRERIPNPLGFVLGVDTVYGDVSPIAHYFRESSGPRQLERAVATAAGLTLLPQAGTLQSRRESCRGWNYVFAWGSVEVTYPHTPLEVGQHYDASYVVGQGIRVFGGQGHGWYQQVDWPAEGLSMDTLCPFRGLTIPHDPIVFEAHEAVGDQFHVRPYVAGDTAQRARWWHWLKTQEIRSGSYLNAALELDTLGQRVRHPGMEFFFRWGLSERALVVDLRLKSVGEEARNRALAFIDEHRMLGVTTILLDR